MSEFLLQFACYYVGRVAVALFTFGRVGCRGMLEEEPPSLPKSSRRPVLASKDQRLRLSAEATSGVGLVFVALLVGLGFLIRHLIARDAAA